jgi:hypothetical protein
MKRLEGYGIHAPDYATLLPEDWDSNPNLAFDAQPGLVTSQNVGIPAYMANLLDPRTIRVLVQPMKAAIFYGEEKKGDWTTLTTQFPVVEATGYTASYNDFSNGGQVGTNANWVPRQSYHFQVVAQFGDREVDMWGLAQINRVAELNYSAALIQMKKLNQTYIFGVNVSGSTAGLSNYGGITDPSLFAPIVPTTKAAGGTTWAVATANEIYNDFLKIYAQAQVQLPGLIDRDTPMSMGISPEVEPFLGQVTQFFTKTVREQIKDNFPNLRIVTLPEFNTLGGNLVQLIIDELEGEKTAYCAFTEKQRAGRVVPDTSWFRQKKVSGSWGTIIRRPVAIIQMLGV